VRDDELQVPPTEAAFDAPGTQAAWRSVRRRIMIKLWLWSVLFLAALALSGAFVDVRLGDEGARGGNSLGGLIGAVAVLLYPFALYTCCGALSRLRKAREILEVYPWRALPAVRKLTGTTEATGVPVQFRLPDGADVAASEDAYVDDDGSVWSQSMSARNPLRWNRWDASMERGAWFAGDLETGGVLALPGGSGLMSVQCRTRVLSMEGRSAKAVHASILAAAPRRG
jgi:hypothetical protein